jgi:hypothetical protein
MNANATSNAHHRIACGFRTTPQLCTSPLVFELLSCMVDNEFSCLFASASVSVHRSAACFCLQAGTGPCLQQPWLLSPNEPAVWRSNVALAISILVRRCKTCWRACGLNVGTNDECSTHEGCGNRLMVSTNPHLACSKLFC